MGILKYVLLFTILLLPLGEVGRYIFPSFGNTPLLLNDIFVAATVSLWIGLVIKRKQYTVHKLWIPICLFLAVCILSLLVNSFWLTLPQLMSSALYILRWGIYAGLFFVVQEVGKTHGKQILWTMLISGQVIIGIGYMQFFLYPSLGNLYYLGWDEHLYRMFSVFLDPNFAGIFFACVFFLTCVPIMEYLHKKQYYLAALLCVVAFVDIAAVYLTYSRTALLTLLVGMIMALLLLSQKKYIVLVLLCLFLGIFLFPKSFQTEGTNLLRIASAESRLSTALQAGEIIQKNPVMGVGFNAYRYAQYKYGYLSGPIWMTSHGGSSTDNSYLFVLATTGSIGGAIFGYLIYRIMSVCLPKEKKTKLDILISATLVGVGISALFNNSLFYVFIMEWVWLAIGLVAVNRMEKKV